ncbi:hypothetical protein [Qaidamihabitans albus]|uniref:hypothetical protein n=1 Tax=Qaidamihabitans albus TaxID=2795733 RepID=UPI0018F124A8|nr:hypothetical protein [Qaidamihabitans albus]
MDQVDQSARNRRRTALVLSAINVALTAVILFWMWPDPARFARETLGFTDGVLDIPLAWLLAALTAVGYTFYTLAAVPFVNGTSSSCPR